MAAEERQKSDQLEDFDVIVKEFLSSCKLDDHYAEFISLGYDCLEYISQMDEAPLNKLTADVGLNKKPGRFVAKLKVYISKSKNKESEAVESKETEKSSTQSVNSQGMLCISFDAKKKSFDL